MSSNSLPRSTRFETWRLFTVYAIILLAFSALLARLLTLQILDPAQWVNQAEQNYTKAVSVPAARGIIYDRNGYILARNLASYNIVITPAELPDDDSDIQRIYREISDLTGIAVGGPVTDESLKQAKLFAACVPGPSISQMVALQESNAPYSPVRIKCNVTEEVARIAQEKTADWPGVKVEVDPIRDYPTGSLTSTLVGFLGPIPASLEALFLTVTKLAIQALRHLCRQSWLAGTDAA
jgi:penicillin-binding protein 2